jgi:hypothetical protein
MVALPFSHYHSQLLVYRYICTQVEQSMKEQQKMIKGRAGKPRTVLKTVNSLKHEYIFEYDAEPAVILQNNACLGGRVSKQPVIKAKQTENWT